MARQSEREHRKQDSPWAQAAVGHPLSHTGTWEDLRKICHLNLNLRRGERVPRREGHPGRQKFLRESVEAQVGPQVLPRSCKVQGMGWGGGEAGCGDRVYPAKTLSFLLEDSRAATSFHVDSFRFAYRSRMDLGLG